NVDLYFSRTSVFAIVLRQALADFRHSAAHHVVVRSVVIRAAPEHFDPDRALFEFGLTAAEGPLDHIPQYGRVAFAVSQNRVGKDFFELSADGGLLGITKRRPGHVGAIQRPLVS